MHILGLAGSLRADSFNTAALRTCQSLLPSGVSLEIFDIAPIPLYNEDVYQQGFPAPVHMLREKITAADALLIATPEYNYSIPGVLKNAIDWVSRPPSQPFDGKPIALMSASPGALGGARSQYHLRQVFIFLNGMILNRPEVMIATAASKFDAAGNLIDSATRDHIAKMLIALTEWTEQLRQS